MAQIITFKKRGDIEADKAAEARVQALDILRGLCVMGMILVAYAGDWAHRFSVLNHADWHGLAVADMIFPGFLFCVGVSLPLSFAGRAAKATKAQLAGHVVIRAVALFGLGLFLNLLPAFDVGHVRIMGILQRIGLCYAIAGLFCLAIGRKHDSGFSLKIWPVLAAAAALLIGYAALLRLWNAPDCGMGCFDSSHSLPTVIDRAVFSVQHLWPYGLTGDQVTFDPEGLLSTAGAVANVLFGVAAGLYIQQRGVKDSLSMLALAGVVLFLAGAGLDGSVPIIKKIWTSSFALFSGGVSLLLFSLLAVITDVWKQSAWATPAKVFGANATLAFVGISLLDTLAQLPLLAGKSLHETAAVALGAAIPDARVASVTYSFILLLILLAVLWPLYSKKIFVKL